MAGLVVQDRCIPGIAGRAAHGVVLSGGGVGSGVRL